MTNMLLTLMLPKTNIALKSETIRKKSKEKATKIFIFITKELCLRNINYPL